MIFEPNSNELYNINEIHKFNESEYVLIRLTETMIKKIILMLMLCSGIC